MLRLVQGCPCFNLALAIAQKIDKRVEAFATMTVQSAQRLRQPPIGMPMTFEPKC